MFGLHRHMHLSKARKYAFDDCIFNCIKTIQHEENIKRVSKYNLVSTGLRGKYILKSVLYFKIHTK